MDHSEVISLQTVISALWEKHRQLQEPTGQGISSRQGDWRASWEDSPAQGAFELRSER